MEVSTLQKGKNPREGSISPESTAPKKKTKEEELLSPKLVSICKVYLMVSKIWRLMVFHLYGNFLDCIL